jgi:DNA repair exonuclease SbcCD ATPase subunit
MFVIKEIATRNFVGHHERSLVFPATGIVLVTGRNGAGKSPWPATPGR